MNWLVAETIRRNAARRQAWTDYAAHRAETTARILHAARKTAERLCILGAGNCDDLDLATLMGAYGEVHLVDLDGDALRRAVSRLPESQRRAIRLHGGVDLTGCWSSLGSRRRGESLADSEIDAVLQACAALPLLPLPGPFDVLASTCVISQLIDGAVLALGSTHPRLLEMVVSLRTNHLQLMAQLLSPGGRGVLMSDFVSSDTLPALRQTAEPNWPALIDDITARGNFFHGLNPGGLLAAFGSDAALAARVADAHLTGFWRWQQAKRVYAVVAIEFTVVR